MFFCWVYLLVWGCLYGDFLCYFEFLVSVKVVVYVVILAFFFFEGLWVGHLWGVWFFVGVLLGYFWGLMGFVVFGWDVFFVGLFLGGFAFMGFLAIGLLWI